MSDPLPEKSLGDHLHLMLRAGISAIPALGGPALELFNAVIAPPIERRRNAWMNNLADRLRELEQENRLKIDDLAGNEEFISAVLQASTSALRNHQEEKIEALRNAVLNSALGQSPEDAKREMFLAFVDQFTVWHLRTLHELSKSARHLGHGIVPKTSIDEIAKVAMERVPGLRGQQALAETVVEDLCRKGLIFWSGGAYSTFIPLGTQQVSELGQEFLRFISEPRNPDHNR